MGTQLEARVGRRRALARRERQIAELSQQQHGVLSRDQLLAAGLGVRTIRRRVEAGRLHLLHRGVYAFGDGRVDKRGRWMAAVLACGEGALLSHRSAAALWGLARARGLVIDVSSPRGRVRSGIVTHEGAVSGADRAVVDGIPVTTVARTLFDYAEVVDERQLDRAFEEADRLGILEMQALEAVCDRGHGRRALRPVRRLIEEARAPQPTRSPLEDRVLELCRDYDLPMPSTNVEILGSESDAFWPQSRLVIEADSWEFHRHRAAFERDRARDAALQVADYRVVRLTHRRLDREPQVVASELCHLLTQGEGRAST